MDSHDYVCGATFSPENDDDDLVVLNSTFVNGGLTCASLMEKPFYVVCKDLVCFQCGAEEMIDETNDVYPLQKMYFKRNKVYEQIEQESETEIDGKVKPKSSEN